MSLETMPGHLIRRLHQISGQIFQKEIQAAGYDVTPVQFATMEALMSYPGIEQVQVASIIAYDRATIGGVIDRLEQKGFVKREVSKRDKRAREVRLSKSGERVLQKLSPVVQALQDDILQGLTKAERKQFTALLKKAVSDVPEDLP